MFTGIVTDVGEVRSAEQRGDLRLVIATAYDLDTVDLGASISCSGVCLTVVDKGDDWFAVDVSGETLSKTAGDHWRQGAKLNLERALRLGDELGGHIVTGHVDAVASVVGTCAEGDSTRIGVSVPKDLAIMTLGAVYGSTLLVWLDDQSEGWTDTAAFLDRRIEEVMKFEKFKADWRGSSEHLSVSRFLGRLRYPPR